MRSDSSIERDARNAPKGDAEAVVGDARGVADAGRPLPLLALVGVGVWRTDVSRRGWGGRVICM
jgi:hypothetical protein